MPQIPGVTSQGGGHEPLERLFQLSWKPRSAACKVTSWRRKEFSAHNPRNQWALAATEANHTGKEKESGLTIETKDAIKESILPLLGQGSCIQGHTVTLPHPDCMEKL